MAHRLDLAGRRLRSSGQRAPLDVAVTVLSLPFSGPCVLSDEGTVRFRRYPDRNELWRSITPNSSNLRRVDQQDPPSLLSFSFDGRTPACGEVMAP